MKRLGFGQVEPNLLSAQKTGQLPSQLPAAKDIEILENGQFVKYDYANNEVNFTGKGEWMMVFNEIKNYRDYEYNTRFYAMRKEDFTPGGPETHYGVGPFEGQMTPRCLKTNVGDVYTTNCLAVPNDSARAEVDMGEFAVGDVLSPNATGYLAKDGDGTVQFQVVKVYTMPDGQAGVKLMRIA
jgi:hypothetical protein